MEREDESSTGRYTREEPAGDAPDRPAGPSQPDDGFAEGAEHRRVPGEDEPDYARGADAPREDDDEIEREPDFARGIDAAHDDDKAEGRYSRGAEAPATEEASHEGRFSEGIEELPHED